MIRWIVFLDPAPDDALATTLAHGCAGFFTGIPPVWNDLSVEQEWTFPCIVTQAEDGGFVSWAPVT